MFTRRQTAAALILVACLTLLLLSTGQAGALLQGQDDDGPPNIDLVTPVPPLEVEEAPAPVEGEEEVAPAGGLAIEAAPLKTMNYQGVLKDGDGTLLSGTYDMTFRLYNAAAGGFKRWGDEVHPDVAVQDGLFQVVLGEILAIDPYAVFDEQLYLEVVVDGVTLPRQPLRAVPYAMGLVAGTHVAGATAPLQYGLYVNNTGGRGLYANGNGELSIYSADVTYSHKGFAGPDTYIWIPATNAVIAYDDLAEAHIERGTFGEVAVEADQPGQLVDVLLPLQFERPYGRDYRVTSYTVYYRVTNAATYITANYMRGRDFSTGTATTVESDGTNLTNTSYDDHAVNVDPDFAATSTKVPTNMQFRITTGLPGQKVYLYGVRVRLQSSY